MQGEEVQGEAKGQQGVKEAQVQQGVKEAEEIQHEEEGEEGEEKKVIAIATKVLPKIRKVIAQTKQILQSHAGDLDLVHPDKRASAENMLMLIMLRSRDRSKLVSQLKELCLEFHSESSVMHSLRTIEHVLQKICGGEPTVVGLKSSSPPVLRREVARKLVLKNRELIYGPVGKRYTSIMVTLDPNTMNSSKIRHLIDAGMDCVRITTAHDTREQWTKTIEDLNVAERSAFAASQRKLLMHWDLAGPKLRTLPIVNAGCRVRRFRCIKDAHGRVKETCLISFVKGDVFTGECVPVSETLFARRIEVADVISLLDARGKTRHCYVVEVGTDRFVAESLATMYLETGTELKLMRRGKELARGVVGALPLVGADISLHVGASLTLVPDTEPGSLEDRCVPVDLAGADVRVGHSVLLDDGQVLCTVTSVLDSRIVLRVDRCPSGFHLKPEKGVNLPNSQFPSGVTALTEDDCSNLQWIASLMLKEGRPFTLGVSFVRSAQDVRDVFRLLTDLGLADKCSTCFKIETLRALQDLPSLLFASLWSYPCVFMLARGDLAGEIGFDRLPGAQDDVVVLTNACHVPLIFATQVLETLSKDGTPSRAEMSDVTQGAKTECIMLNKGPYLIQTVKFLDQVLRDVQKRQHKHRVQLRTLSTVDLEHYKFRKAARQSLASLKNQPITSNQ